MPRVVFLPSWPNILNLITFNNIKLILVQLSISNGYSSFWEEKN